MPLSEAKDKLSGLVDDVELTHEMITITRHGRPAVVLIALTTSSLCRKRSCGCLFRGSPILWLWRNGITPLGKLFAAMTFVRSSTACDMTGGHVIQVSSEALLGLNRLPAKVATAIVEFVTVTSVKIPQHLGKPLRGDLEAYRSARRGDYRSLIRIDEDKRSVLVIRVDHRAHAYRSR